HSRGRTLNHDLTLGGTPDITSAKWIPTYMEYIQDHGWFADLPLDRIFASYEGFRFDDSDKIVDEKFA
ncbi:hypothetical protein, partial [Agromyces bauzanensis]|uniref:hypothetical protein n=1 Tax=Agromyces bauzanensis TaxID=1308924 RepID=UPI003CD08A3F